VHLILVHQSRDLPVPACYCRQAPRSLLHGSHNGTPLGCTASRTPTDVTTTLQAVILFCTLQVDVINFYEAKIRELEPAIVAERAACLHAAPADSFFVFFR